MKIIKKLKDKFNKSRVRERENLSDPDKQIRREMYDRYEAELRSRELSNSQQYDKAILTLSSAGFALSVTALEYTKKAENIDSNFLIICSWWLFFSAITFSLLSFVVGNAAINRQIKFARDYYIECFKDAVSKTSLLVKISSLLNFLAGIAFLSAIAFTITFFTRAS